MTIKVWGILEGPVNVNEIFEDDEGLDDLLSMDVPDDSSWFMVCKTEIDGKIQPANFWFESMNDAYEWQKHFARSIEPLIVDDKYKEYMT